MLQKKWWKKNFKIAAIGMMTSLIMSIILKIYAKNGENMFFSKMNLMAARKKIFKTFFRLLKIQITDRLNICVG